MEKFLQIAGILFAAMALLIALVLIASSPSRGLIFLPVAGWAVSAVVGGAIIAAFGSMLGHLKAIRFHAEKQSMLLEDRNRYQPVRSQEAPSTPYSHPGPKPNLSDVKTRFTDT
jgi:uncharacterized membrane protein